jgi:hypothetical protein
MDPQLKAAANRRLEARRTRIRRIRLRVAALGSALFLALWGVIAQATQATPTTTTQATPTTTTQSSSATTAVTTRQS